MKSEITFQATIYVGLTAKYAGKIFTFEQAVAELRKYTDEYPFCVSVTPTHFVYKDGDEAGIAVGIINYPRFPESDIVLLDKTTDIAKVLGRAFKQYRVSVVTPYATYMLEEGVDY